MKIMCKCRNCDKVYEEAQARGDWKGYCSAKCQHAKAHKLGYQKKKFDANFTKNTEYETLNKAKAIGSVYVVQVTVPGASKPDWREVQQITPVTNRLKCPECGKLESWYESTTDKKTKLVLHDDPKGNRCPGGGLWTSLVPGAFEASQAAQDQQADAEEDTKRPERIELREKFRSYITERLAEYISEAEHGDGEGYWDQFTEDRLEPSTATTTPLQRAVIDFITFLEALEGE